MNWQCVRTSGKATSGLPFSREGVPSQFLCNANAAALNTLDLDRFCMRSPGLGLRLAEVRSDWVNWRFSVTKIVKK
jgi:hypothetical protein